MRYITEGIIEKLHKVLADTGDIRTLQSSGGNSTAYELQDSVTRNGMIKSVMPTAVTNEFC
jgi:hypothetical protein